MTLNFPSSPSSGDLHNASNGLQYHFDGTKWTSQGAYNATTISTLNFTQQGTGAVSRSVQNKLEDVVSVKDFNATGDGTTDDTTAIQAAIDSITSGGTVIFPPGTYKVSYQASTIGCLHAKEGQHLLGFGNAIIKKADSQPNNSRLITIKSANKWDQAYDSPPLIIENLIFDGNRTGTGYTYDAGDDRYEDASGNSLSQSHCIFLNAEITSAGRLRAIINNCTFKENVGDGISVYKNVDVSINNCFFEDCFRGGIVVTGGTSKVRASNCIMRGETHKTGIDIEVDGAGYNSSNAVDIEFTNLELDGDFDCTNPSGGTVKMSNINSLSAPFNIGGEGHTLISNSHFKIGLKTSSSDRIVKASDLTFSNCKFELTEISEATSTLACAHIYFNSGGSTLTDQRIRFYNCVFDSDSSVEDADTTYGIYQEADLSSRNNYLIVEGCEFKSLDEGIHIEQGGHLRIKDCHFASTMALYTKRTSTYEVDLYMSGGTFDSTCTTFQTIYNGAAGSTYFYDNVTLDEAKNVITLSGTNPGDSTFTGGRRILGSSAPSSEPGFKGDIYQIKVPTAGQLYSWVATTNSASSATWQPLIYTEGDSGELTIASGVITVTGNYHSVDTEGDASSDDLATINGGRVGQVLILLAENAGRTVVVKDGTGNIQLDGGDFSLDHTRDSICLIWNGSNWLQIASSNAS